MEDLHVMAGVDLDLASRFAAALAAKDQQLAHLVQLLKQYADRIAALEGELANVKRYVTRWVRETRNGFDVYNANPAPPASERKDPPAGASLPSDVQPLATEPPSAVQLSAAGHLSSTSPPPAPAPLPPAPRLIVCFSIVTFGLRTLQLAGAISNEDIIARALAATWPDIRADVFIDARLFRDPGQHGVGQGHTGMHRDILTRIAWHSEFRTWWYRQMNRTMVAPPQHRRPGCMDVCVAIYCNAGKHRSVAASIFLEVGLRSRLLDVAGTQHLSSHTWQCCSGRCRNCKDPLATARRLLQNRKLL